MIQRAMSDAVDLCNRNSGAIQRNMVPLPLLPEGSARGTDPDCSSITARLLEFLNVSDSLQLSHLLQTHWFRLRLFLLHSGSSRVSYYSPSWLEDYCVAVLVSFPITIIDDSDKRNLRKEGFIRTHSLKHSPSCREGKGLCACSSWSLSICNQRGQCTHACILMVCWLPSHHTVLLNLWVDCFGRSNNPFTGVVCQIFTIGGITVAKLLL